MNYLNLLPEITALSLAYLEIRELLSLFESVSFLNERYWNDQRFWNTIFHFRISPLSFPKAISDPNSVEMTITTRSSYISLLEHREACLSTHACTYASLYINQIGFFNSRQLIEEFFDIINPLCDWENYGVYNDIENSKIPYYQLFSVACHHGHLDLMIDMLSILVKHQSVSDTDTGNPFTDLSETNSCKGNKQSIYLDKGLASAVGGGQHHILEYLENKCLEYKHEINITSLLDSAISQNQREMFDKLLLKITGYSHITYFFILHGAIYFDNKTLFDQYSSRIKDFTSDSYLGLVALTMINNCITRDHGTTSSHNNSFYLLELMSYLPEFVSVKIQILTEALINGETFVLQYLIDNDYSVFIHHLKFIINETNVEFDINAVQFVIKNLFSSVTEKERQKMIDNNIIDFVRTLIYNDNSDRYLHVIKELLPLTSIPIDNFKTEINPSYFHCDYQVSSLVDGHRKLKRRYYQYMDLLGQYLKK